MEPVIQDLIDLHRIEVRIQVLETFLASAPAKESELKAEREQAKQRMEMKREELNQTRSDLKRKDRALSDGEERTRQLQGKLNQVKTNKEYEAALKEIQEQKLMNGGLEEEILILLDKVEEAERAERELEANWNERSLEFEARERKLKTLTEEVDRELAEKKDVRTGLRSRLSSELVKLFDKIKTAKGMALARIDKEICHGCHRQLPSQLYNEVLKANQVITCPSCDRILVHLETELEEGLMEIEP